MLKNPSLNISNLSYEGCYTLLTYHNYSHFCCLNLKNLTQAYNFSLSHNKSWATVAVCHSIHPFYICFFYPLKKSCFEPCCYTPPIAPLRSTGATTTTTTTTTFVTWLASFNFWHFHLFPRNGTVRCMRKLLNKIVHFFYHFCLFLKRNLYCSCTTQFCL